MTIRLPILHRGARWPFGLGCCRASAVIVAFVCGLHSPVAHAIDEGETDLSVSASVLADPVSAGATVGYSIQLINNGPDLAQAVNLSVLLEAGSTAATWTSASGSAGWNCAVSTFSVDCQNQNSAILGLNQAVTIALEAIDSSEGTLCVSGTLVDLGVDETSPVDSDFSIEPRRPTAPSSARPEPRNQTNLTELASSSDGLRSDRC